MPWNLFGKTREEREAEELEDRKARGKIEALSREIELYNSRDWNTYFRPRLEKILTDDLNALIGCPEEEVPVVRARIKVVRHLAELKDNLEHERAELQRRREGGGEDE